MLAGDAILLGMLAVTGLGIYFKTRGAPTGNGLDSVVMRSIPGLIIFGTIFLAIAAAVLIYGIVSLTTPMEVVQVRKFGGIGVHSWAFGIAGIVIGGVITIIPLLLFGKARQILRQNKVERVPAATPVIAARPVVTRTPAEARTAALAQLTEVPGSRDPLGTLAAIARDVARDIPDLRGADWQRWLDALDAARFSGGAANPEELARQLRALLE